jgi:hypothetical protein
MRPNPDRRAAALLQRGAAKVFAGGDIVHFRRDDAAAGIVHLADIGAGAGAQGALHHIGKGGDAAAAVGAELAVVLGFDRAGCVILDIAARDDPVAAQGARPALMSMVTRGSV